MLAASRWPLKRKEYRMRKAFIAVALLVTGLSLSGCWHDRYGHGGPGHNSDHHHDGDRH
jgi:hypothetical protein